MKKISIILSLVLALLVGSVLGTYGSEKGWMDWLPGGEDTESSREVFLPAKYNVDLGLFWVVWDMLEKDYLKEDALDVPNMTYGAIKGFVNSLDDPYTVFMDPNETEEFTASLDGKLEGIGAELTVIDGKLTIVTPLKNSPAEKAGLRPSDIIYKIEDEFSVDLTLFDAIMKIRGPSGTSVNLTILREDVRETFEVDIRRAQINLESVTREYHDNIAYVSINQFSDNTADEFEKVVSELVLKDLKGMVIDLRFNGGGYLDAAVDVLSSLLEKNLAAATIRERVGKMGEETLVTNGGTKVLDVPLVVLVNEGSASASEIVAGALQDHERGVIMGTQTFGKGTVQAVEFLEDGSSLRMTIAQWFTPEERVIQGIGITPDITVENYDEDVMNGYDRQLEEALKYLRGL